MAGRPDQLHHGPGLRRGREFRPVIPKILACGRAYHRQGYRALPHHLLAHLFDVVGAPLAQAGIRPPVAADGRQQDEQIAREHHLRRRAGARVRRGRGALLCAQRYALRQRRQHHLGAHLRPRECRPRQQFGQFGLAHGGDVAEILRRGAGRYGLRRARGRRAEGAGNFSIPKSGGEDGRIQNFGCAGGDLLFPAPLQQVYRRDGALGAGQRRGEKGQACDRVVQPGGGHTDRRGPLTALYARNGGKDRPPVQLPAARIR